MLDYGGTRNFLRYPGFKFKSFVAFYDKNDQELLNKLLSVGLKVNENIDKFPSRDLIIKRNIDQIETEKFDVPLNLSQYDATVRFDNANIKTVFADFLAVKELPYFWFNEPKLFGLDLQGVNLSHFNQLEPLKQFVSKVIDCDDIWIADSVEFYDYVTAFDRLEFSADGVFAHNPSAVDVYIKYMFDKNVIVPSGKTVKLL